MYDELKERCRACSQGCIYPSECSYFDKPPFRCMRQLLSEAADAIEELLPFKKQVEKGMGLLDKADELLKAVKPRWIPVTERLPEDRRDVQITVFWHDAWRTMYGYYDGAFWHLYAPMHTEVADVEVIGWMEKPAPMPLPQPPKEG